MIYDTLINQSTIPEVVAVLAHEIGHWKLNHRSAIRDSNTETAHILQRSTVHPTLVEHSSHGSLIVCVSIHHSIKNLVLIQLQTILLFYTFSLTLTQPRLYTDFGFTSRATYIGLLLFQFLYSPMAHVSQFLLHVVSRRAEYEADAYAVGLGKGKELANGLITLHRENKGTMINDPWWSAYHHSHPPVLDRLRAIERRKKE